jgi:hypothetical protein
MLRSPVTQQNRPKPESGLSGSSEGDKALAPGIIQHGTKVWHGACRYGKSALSATHLKADLVPHTGCLGADTSNFRRFTDSSLRIQELTAIFAGNAAYQQLQLDIYLEMIDSMPPLFSCYS